ncbi:MAG: serine protease [Sandaracinaceae bacterium]|nr:serine protease [Sandaracinaceae bacterium]
MAFRWLLALSLALIALGPAAARAQELTRAVRERCITSVARIEVDTPRGTLSGTGTVIDARGYVLTNFHVAGHADQRTGLPGTHHARRYRVAITRTERDEVEDRYVAEVVRGSLPLDLALLRIVEHADGTPLTSADTFAPMTIRDGSPELGTQVWALGFPAGVRTVNITAGQVAGFERNADGETAWLRTDTEFNPGNSGGALIDRECRLVGVPTAVSDNVEPIELARPATRIPAHWLVALRAGTVLASEPTEGILPLSTLTELVDVHLGDSAGRGGELRFYALPRERPGVVSITPRLDMGIVGAGGRILREGEGQALVTASDPASSLVIVFVPRGQSGAFPRVRVRYTPMTSPASVAGSGSAVRGRVALADGGSCRTFAVLAARDVDLARLSSDLSRGVVSEAEFRRRTHTIAATDDEGAFALSAPSGPYVLGFLTPSLGAQGVEAREVEVPAGGLDVGTITLSSACP